MIQISEYQWLIDELLQVYGVKVLAPYHENDNHKVIIWLKDLALFIEKQNQVNATALWVFHHISSKKAADLILNDAMKSLSFDQNDINVLHWSIIKVIDDMQK